jgi:3-oxoacyl-[acyl-carrier-protein] synthase II
LERRGVSPEEIGFINANARGDVALDAAEALALRDVFGDKLDLIPVTSLKGAIGNPGAGAGAIETVAGLISLQDDALFPTLNFETPDPNCSVVPVTKYGAPTGDSFVKICANNLGQASAALFKRWSPQA